MKPDELKIPHTFPIIKNTTKLHYANSGNTYPDGK